MRRSTLRRVIAGSATAVVLAVLSGCGSDPERPWDEEGASSSPSSSAPSSSAPQPEITPEPGDTAGEGEGNPVNSEDAAVVAQTFVEHTLSSADLLNAPTIEDAVNQVSAYLSPRTADALITLGHQDPVASFRMIPWNMPMVEGAVATSARAEIVSITQGETTPQYTDIYVVATFRFEWQSGEWNTGTRTLSLRMIPAADDSGMKWWIDGAEGTDTDLVEG